MRFYHEHTLYRQFYDGLKADERRQMYYKGWVDPDDLGRDYSSEAKASALANWVGRFPSNDEAAAAPELPASLREAALRVNRRAVEQPRGGFRPPRDDYDGGYGGGWGRRGWGRW